MKPIFKWAVWNDYYVNCEMCTVALELSEDEFSWGAPTGLYIINLKSQGNVHLFIFSHILVVITTENMTYDSTLYLSVLHLFPKSESQTLRSWVLPDWCYFV